MPLEFELIMERRVLPYQGQGARGWESPWGCQMQANVDFRSEEFASPAAPWSAQASLEICEHPQPQLWPETGEATEWRLRQ